jgi:hypothetical protein
MRASIPRKLLYLFRHQVYEGAVYNMSNFKVGTESGVYRPTGHPYKLIFDVKTEIEKCENNRIDRNGLSLINIGVVCGYGPDHEFLIGTLVLCYG